ncbi:lambda family phage portal protein [Sphingomonas vulcanisoli]|uniref:Lambda family phage portal protein n=1 Tax=Sphingomonas vulcanisoli TaxID=1658060 RepID=A0ABX0TSM7_9SPHN|nr:phage portal protein [Sphingomonas vulcanisoli]NIJ07230.1 lambda family phage portal protein [Sphingomonas vulcanisoli]
MPQPPAVLDSAGRPIAPAQIQRIRESAGRPGRMRSLQGGGGAGNAFPYDAADILSSELGDWIPQVRSPDTEINLHRDRIAARARDLRRNDAWANGAISRILDSTIGASYRFVSKPDYRALALYARGFDAVWANEYRQALEAKWRTYSEDLGHYNDVHRQLTISQQFRLALGHKLVDGESVLVAQWRPDRIRPGGATYATCFEGIDPDRLSNPNMGPDTATMRNGVELDGDMVHVAYHIRRAHQFDWYNSIQSMEWDRVEREDPDGWRRVYHDYDPDRFGQSRGISVFAPAIRSLKMLSRLYGVKLQAENVAAAFGLYVQSPYDFEMVRNALENEDDDEQAFGWYQDLRSEFHKERQVGIKGAHMASLAPGEEIKSVAPGGGQADIRPFAHEMLRAFSMCLGTSAEEITNDYSDASWSSARAGITQSEKTYHRRTDEFDLNTATPVLATWLEEPFERNELPLPRNAPSYLEMRTAYARGRWLGAARGWVDPVSERQGVVLGLDAGLSTMEEECAKQGMDWEENLEQRAIEFNRMQMLGLPRPEWFGNEYTATEASQPPQKAQP